MLLNYVVTFAIGGLVFMGMYHFAAMKNEFFMAIVMTMPVRLLAGYIYSLSTNVDLQKVTETCCPLFALSLIVLVMAAFLLRYMNRHLAIWLALLFWLVTVLSIYFCFK